MASYDKYELRTSLHMHTHVNKCIHMFHCCTYTYIYMANVIFYSTEVSIPTDMKEYR